MRMPRKKRRVIHSPILFAQPDFLKYPRSNLGLSARSLDTIEAMPGITNSASPWPASIARGSAAYGCRASWFYRAKGMSSHTGRNQSRRMH